MHPGRIRLLVKFNEKCNQFNRILNWLQQNRTSILWLIAPLGRALDLRRISLAMIVNWIKSFVCQTFQINFGGKHFFNWNHRWKVIFILLIEFFEVSGNLESRENWIKWNCRMDFAYYKSLFRRLGVRLLINEILLELKFQIGGNLSGKY